MEDFGQGSHRRATMADVGRLAKVSAQTVSRYYTGGYVSRSTRLLIDKAVQELDYRPNRLPQSLRAGHTDTIGLLLMSPITYGSSGILTGIGRRARAEGQALVINQLDLDPSAASSQVATVQPWTISCRFGPTELW